MLWSWQAHVGQAHRVRFPIHDSLMADAREPHVLILGGGFGSLRATRVLASAPVRTTLVDRTNHHLFHPLLY